jgi:hypothetical protein
VLQIPGQKLEDAPRLLVLDVVAGLGVSNAVDDTGEIRWSSLGVSLGVAQWWRQWRICKAFRRGYSDWTLRHGLEAPGAFGGRDSKYAPMSHAISRTVGRRRYGFVDGMAMVVTGMMGTEM